MRTTSRVQGIKEARALMAPWALLLVAVIGAHFMLDVFTLPVAVAGAIGLGAWSVGHDYSYRTLPLQLAQPVNRTWLWLHKILVLLAMIAVIAVTAALLLPDRDMWLLIGAGAGVTLAPWLTMVSRNARAGIIFTIAVLLFWFIAGTWIRENTGAPVVEAGFVAIVLAAGVLGWRAFQALPAIDERTEHLTLPDTWPHPARDRSHPVSRSRRLFALLGKELSLQAPVLLLSTLFVLAWVGRWTLNDTGTRDLIQMVATLFHAGTVPMLAGALASAEERRLGAWDTQALQPMSSRAQWLLKVFVVMAVAIGCAVALPMLLAQAEISLLGRGDVRQFVFGALFYHAETQVAIPLVVLLLAALGLYASSLSHNAVQALLASIAMGVVTAAGLNGANGVLMRARAHVLEDFIVEVRSALGSNPPAWMYVRDQLRALEWMTTTSVLLTTVGAVLLLVIYAGDNHRVADQRSKQLAIQIAVLAALPIIGLIALRVLPVLLLRL
jgi:hypothetical protein